MTEIPIAEPDDKPEERPVEIKALVLLVVGDAIVGLIAAVSGLAWSGDALSALGFIVAVIALWVAKGLWDYQAESWNWALILSIIGIVLYIFSTVAFEGILLSVMILIFLNIPNVKKYYQ